MTTPPTTPPEPRASEAKALTKDFIDRIRSAAGSCPSPSGHCEAIWSCATIADLVATIDAAQLALAACEKERDEAKVDRESWNNMADDLRTTSQVAEKYKEIAETFRMAAQRTATAESALAAANEKTRLSAEATLRAAQLVTDMCENEDAIRKVLAQFDKSDSHAVDGIVDLAEAATTALASAQERARVLEGALESIAEYWNGHDNPTAMANACEVMRKRALQALSPTERPAPKCSRCHIPRSIGCPCGAGDAKEPTCKDSSERGSGECAGSLATTTAAASKAGTTSGPSGPTTGVGTRSTTPVDPAAVVADTVRGGELERCLRVCEKLTVILLEEYDRGFVDPRTVRQLASEVPNIRKALAPTPAPSGYEELRAYAEALCAACEVEYESELTASIKDSHAVSGGPTGESPITFGMIRNLRKALAAARKVG